MKVYPVEGRLVRDPHSRRPVPAEGRDVPGIPFWHRRLRDGDVTLDAPATAAAAADHHEDDAR